VDLKIKGKVAVVVAASRGLGRAVAEALAAEGVNLAICSRNKEGILEAAADIRTAYNVDVLPSVCDVTNPSEINRFKNDVIGRFQTCHILFTNADGPPSGKLADFSAEHFQKAIDLNLMSTINLVYAFWPCMKRQKWGRVLASTSSNVRHLLPMFPLSNVSRIGVVAFIKTLATEFGRWNITANVLAPGFFMTEPTKEYLEDQAQQEGISYQAAVENLQKAIPTRTIGDPKDYGALAAFLASEHASHNRRNILIDGGQYAGRCSSGEQRWKII
jgi:3-oxoacyl-[acyl-carrier protein] reductase